MRKRKRSVLLSPRLKEKKIDRIISPILCLLMLLLAAPTYPQSSDIEIIDENDSVIFDDLGLTLPVGSGARSAGMAGAYTSIGGDVHSLVYNPSGLSQLRRIEISFGLQYEHNQDNVAYFDSRSNSTHSLTNIGHFSVAYPFPAYRGSLVGAIGVYRLYSSPLKIFYDAFNSIPLVTRDYFAMQNTGSIYSYNIGFAVELAPALSFGASAFLLDGSIEAFEEFDFEYLAELPPDSLRRQILSQDIDLDVGGYGGIVGIQYYPHRRVTLGLSVATPAVINAEGDGFFLEDLYYENLGGFEDSGFFVTDDRFYIPFRINLGASLKPQRSFLVSMDIAYSDWTQASFNRARLTDEHLTNVFRQVIEFRAGAEITLPHAPLRIRGGYAYLPYPLDYLQADRISNLDLQPARISKERQLFSFGAGGLISRVLSMDFAFIYITGERATPKHPSRLKYARTTRRFLLSASYRF